MNTHAKSHSKSVSRTARRASAQSSSKRPAIGLRAKLRSVADAIPPVNDGAKVKLDLASRSDLNLLAFAENHIAEMAGNANFPRPLPSAPAFELVTTDFLDAITAYEAAKTALANASQAKDAARLALTESFTARGSYVQAASNGNALVIASSGLELRNPRMPVGQLSWPQNVKVELNGARGLMIVNWKAVPKAEGYAVRQREVGSEVWDQLPRCNKPKLELTDMPVGKTFAFQVATLGGAGGQSLWSPEVTRAAA